ncbi:uncharacterized protein LOC144582522 isoform X2 [Callithrix jacchus]
MHAGAGVVRARARWTRKRHSEPEVEVVCRLPGGFSVASTAPELSASYSPRSSARTRQPRPLPSAGRCRPFPRGMGCGAWRSSSGISATEEESCSGTQCSSAITVHSTSPAQVILPPQSPKTPGLEPNLLIPACNQLGQFLQHLENNLRYLALESMFMLASSEFSHKAVKTHIETIINALKALKVAILAEKYAVDYTWGKIKRELYLQKNTS